MKRCVLRQGRQALPLRDSRDSESIEAECRMALKKAAVIRFKEERGSDQRPLSRRKRALNEVGFSGKAVVRVHL
jgi:hypothetical protein